MKKLKSTQRIQDAVAGKLPYEELTMKEIRKLERMVFEAIARKVQDRIAPSTTTRH